MFLVRSDWLLKLWAFTTCYSPSGIVLDFSPQVFFNQLTETIVAYWALCQLVWNMVKELSMYRDVADKGEFISRVPRKTFTTVWPYLGELTIQI